MFSGHEVWSSIKQGNLGNCYVIAAMASLDNRPGALERLFVTTKINEAGIYAVKFWMNGRQVIVHVDDYVPVVQRRVKDANGKDVVGYYPAFAESRTYGEIWPSILEKAWTKLVGY